MSNKFLLFAFSLLLFGLLSYDIAAPQNVQKEDDAINKQVLDKKKEEPVKKDPIVEREELRAQLPIERFCARYTSECFRPDFRDKEIQDFIKMMSAVIGKNIITSDNVRGKITVISPQPIFTRDALQYFTLVLSVRGFGVVSEGGALRIDLIKETIAANQLIIYGNKPWLEIPDEEFKTIFGDGYSKDSIKEERVITQILTLEHVQPSRMLNILQRLSNPQTIIIDYNEIRTLIISGTPLEVNRVVKISNMLDIEQTGTSTTGKKPNTFGNFHFYQLDYMESDKVAQVLNTINVPENFAQILAERKDPSQAQTTTTTTNQQNANVKIPDKKLQLISHKESNSIIYVGTELEWEQVLLLIQELDKPRDQVLVEVLIAEVSADGLNSYGIDWRVAKDGLAQFNSGTIANSGLYNPTTGTFSGLNTLTGFSLGFLADTAGSVMGLIELNASKSNFTILSSPQVLTIDNQEAEISVGEDVPVKTASRTADTAGAAIIDQYQYRPTGLKLKFTPRINKNRMVTLALQQEINEITNRESSTGNPSFTKREIKTNVRVKDKQTIVIGGLLSKQKTNQVIKIPLLGDIPLLGYLFKRTSVSTVKKNLLVFITPHILTSRERADFLTKEASDLQKQDILEILKDSK